MEDAYGFFGTIVPMVAFLRGRNPGEKKLEMAYNTLELVTVQEALKKAEVKPYVPKALVGFSFFIKFATSVGEREVDIKNR